MALPSPAYAIDKVGCGKPVRDDFLVIQHQVGPKKLDTHCFANRGSVKVALHDVWSISSGNNKVVVEYVDDLGQSTKGMILDKWQGWGYLWNKSPNINGKIHISKITIL
ncbi:hypothetical protein C1I98_32950 [Spongiactinospora gelatinilytica]|uniref:Streptomyces killer toxin-like beta/gamma crystallin domain-containing protein n=1 Tax=Spongiactinospora gelatinilytica TaxID=2666298 RepID=A0A2W2G240_9ACTN|nr:beta/gamma crystallin domain-containing protein [Spongiactinospora gelatinilytica]PZG28217.1 hypothetical protein C1I98_32950 [Spongiactinospora gelatinilytica]